MASETAEKVCANCGGTGRANAYQAGRGFLRIPCPNCTPARSPEGDVLEEVLSEDALRASLDSVLQGDKVAAGVVAASHEDLREALEAAERERDEARANVERLRKSCYELEDTVTDTRARYAALRDAVLEAVEIHGDIGVAYVKDHGALTRARRLAEGDGNG